MNGILLVDKPSNWTSHDVIAKLRRVLGMRRIGHCGTLDPMATGLLVVFIGRATRAVEFAQNREKEYIAGLKLGIVTDTQDITGSIIKSSKEAVTEAELRAVLPEFIGEISQIPPMFSAVKVEGQKLYELARRGQEIERKSRRVNIKELELTGRMGEDFLLRVRCSKGTYVRTLCHDIGERLKSGGALSYLRRTFVGDFSVEDALTLVEIEALAKDGGIAEHILPVEILFSGLPRITISGAQKKKCLHGNPLNVSVEDGEYLVYDECGAFLMLGSANGGLMKTVKNFFEV